MRSRRIKKQIWLSEEEDYIMKCNSEAVGMNASDYIRHLIVADETFGARLLSIHNIYFLHKLMAKIRENIKSGTLEEFRDEFVKEYYGEKK